jgi:hypothetical protein
MTSCLTTRYTPKGKEAVLEEILALMR